MKDNLGPDHPLTLSGMNNLAISYANAGRAQEALKLREDTLRLRKAKLGRDHPGTLESMNELADSYITIGQAAKAMAILRDSLALRELRATAEPNNRTERAELACTHGLMGEAEQARLDYAAAVLEYARSVELFDKLDRTGGLNDPSLTERNSHYRKRLALCRNAERAIKDLDFVLKLPAAEVPELLDLRVRFLLNERKLREATESAAKMKERASDKPDQLYAACRAFALCAAAASKQEANAPLANRSAEEAMALLKQAVAKGFRSAPHMKEDNDLDALRGREDFRKLLAALERAKKD
jgi:hypothetical protein